MPQSGAQPLPYQQLTESGVVGGAGGSGGPAGGAAGAPDRAQVAVPCMATWEKVSEVTASVGAVLLTVVLSPSWPLAELVPNAYSEPLDLIAKAELPDTKTAAQSVLLSMSLGAPASVVPPSNQPLLL